ncbi:MAG: hypothetical protein ACRCXZ_00340 [Patescibacteria group bacterium]
MYQTLEELDSWTYHNIWVFYVFLNFGYKWDFRTSDYETILKAQNFLDSHTTLDKKSICYLIEVRFLNQRKVKDCLLDYVQNCPTDWLLLALYARIHQDMLFRHDCFILQIIRFKLVTKLHCAFEELEHLNKTNLISQMESKIYLSNHTYTSFENSIRMYLPPL